MLKSGLFYYRRSLKYMWGDLKQYQWLNFNSVRCDLLQYVCIVCIIGVTFLPPSVFAGVSCVEEGGESANMTECLRWAGPLPPQIRQCRVACKDDCTLTTWSKFSECAGCGSSRSRKRSLTGKDPTFSHRRKMQISLKATVPSLPVEWLDSYVEHSHTDWKISIHVNIVLFTSNKKHLMLQTGCCLVALHLYQSMIYYNLAVVTLYTHFLDLKGCCHCILLVEKNTCALTYCIYCNPVWPLSSFWFCYCNFLLSLFFLLCQA